MRLAKVELSQLEAMTLLQLVRARHLEMERMIQNMEEGEGMDAGRYNAIRTLRPQVEMLEDLVLKLEGVSKELEGAR